MARNKQFLLFPECFLLNQKMVSPFVCFFDIISLFAAVLKEHEIGISGKGLKHMSILIHRQKIVSKANKFISYHPCKSSQMPYKMNGVVVTKPFPKQALVLCVCHTCLLKIMWEKEKLLVTSNFSFTYIVFYPFGDLSAIFIKIEIVICIHFEFGRV